MEDFDIIEKARMMAGVIIEEEVQADLLILEVFFKINGSDKLLEYNEDSTTFNKHELSKGCIPFILFLRDKYIDESKCMAIFLKIIEIKYNLDFEKPKAKLFSDIAAALFHYIFEQYKHIKIRGFFDLNDTN